ncbi:MAG: SRPBCC domain-containing protein [Solirubrobacteraceae bacterium]
MNASGSTQLDAPRARLYACLSDPRQLEPLLPSVESVEQIGDDELAVRVAPQTALGATPLDLELTVRRERGPEHVRLEGTGRGGEFRTSFQVELEFAENGSGTEVSWQAEAEFNGLLSSIGQRILPAILASQIDAVLRAAADAAG